MPPDRPRPAPGKPARSLRAWPWRATLLLGAAVSLAVPLFMSSAPIRGQPGPTPPAATVTPPALPLQQTSGTPGGVALPPGGTVSFLDSPAAAEPLAGAVRLLVQNRGDQVVSARYDGLTLMLFASDPSIDVQAATPDAPCSTTPGLAYRVFCGPLPGRPAQQVSVTTAARPADAAPSTPLYPPLWYHALLAPGSGELSAGAAALIVLPGNDAPATLGVHNISQDVDARIADDGASLTISVPAGNALLTSGVLNPPSAATPCLPVDDQPNVVTCAHAAPAAGANPGTVWFMAVPVPDAGAATPAALIPGTERALLVAATPGGAAPALVAVQYGDFPGGFANRNFGVEAIALYASWDGTTLSLSAPAGFRLDPFAEAGNCAPSSDQPNTLLCAPANQLPLLLSVRAQSIEPGSRPGFGPPPRLGGWLLQLKTAPSVLAVGETGTFAGGVFVRNPGEPAGPFDYIITWGDGTAEAGAAADHAYAAPGSYTVTLFALEQATGIVSMATTVVTVMAP